MRSEELQPRGFIAKALLAMALVFTPHSSLLTPHCLAHQVPRSEYDRNVTVKIRTDGLIVVYRVDLDEFTLLQLVSNPANGFPLSKTGKIGRKEITDAFVARMKEVILTSRRVRGRKPVQFICTPDPHANGRGTGPIPQFISRSSPRPSSRPVPLPSKSTT